MVSNGWNRIALEKIAEVRSGVAKGKKGLKAPIEVPYLRVANVQDGHIDLTEVKTIEIEQDKLERYSLKYGDVLMNEGGDYDKLGRGDVWLGQIEPCLHQNHVFAVRPNQDIIDSFFLAALAASNYGKTYFLSCAKRSTNLASINSTQIKEFPVLVPPLPEQKKIAQILSTWDMAITTTEQLLANSQQQKKALMQQLLTGKKRLLDKNGVRFSGEWKFQSISQISKRIQRKSDGEDHPILTISSLSGFVRQDERYSRYMAGESVKNYILLKKGEFAYNKGNSKTYEFGCIFDLDSHKSGLVPHVYVCFKLHQGLSHRYFKYLFEADYLKPQLGALVNTGVRNNGLLNIKPAEFMNTKVPVPSFDEQERIADVLHASSETINKLQLKIDSLKQEKKALMQQLLTGKRRVLVS